MPLFEFLLLHKAMKCAACSAVVSSPAVTTVHDLVDNVQAAFTRTSTGIVGGFHAEVQVGIPVLGQLCSDEFGIVDQLFHWLGHGPELSAASSTSISLKCCHFLGGPLLSSICACIPLL